MMGTPIPTGHNRTTNHIHWRSKRYINLYLARERKEWKYKGPEDVFVSERNNFKSFQCWRETMVTGRRKQRTDSYCCNHRRDNHGQSHATSYHQVPLVLGDVSALIPIMNLKRKIIINHLTKCKKYRALNRDTVRHLLPFCQHRRVFR